MPEMDVELRKAAEAAPGFMPADEGLALYDAAVSVGVDGPLVEIGSWLGKSTLYLAAAARARKTYVVTVDHHRGSEEHQPGWEYHDASLVDPDVGRIDTLPGFRRTTALAGVEDVVVGVVAKSEVLASLWALPVGFLFLDGGHTDEAAQRDYACWSPHLARGGTLAIHDVFPDPAHGGQAPYRMYLRAHQSGDYDELPGTGSLRLLRRR
jgi:predicted O-methyltransferase YrrM